MKTHFGVSLSLTNENFADLVTHLETCSNKSEIVRLQINGIPINIVKQELFDGYSNLTDLNLSNCNINNFEETVFHSLIHLKSIDLSNNAIKLIKYNLFNMNRKLEVIILKHNLLITIGNSVFLLLGSLKKLDLSYNRISTLKSNFIICPSIRVLFLNNNYINNINPLAFCNQANLIHLALHRNKLFNLEPIFDNLINLQHLDLSYNLITYLHLKCFWSLVKLNYLNLKNNNLTKNITFYTLIQHSKLIDLDLSDNNITSIRRSTFTNCPNLKILKLAVTFDFEISCIKHLNLLTHFELFYKIKDNFFLMPSFWKNFYNKNHLVIIKLMFQKLNSFVLCNFAIFENLEKLHFESMEPNDLFIHEIRINSNFNGIRKLESLTLKKLNNFTAKEFRFKVNKLTYLNLSGIKNMIFNYEFSSYIHLEYLDLSFSEIQFITENTFRNLVNLEHLQLGFSKLKSIGGMVFNYNRKLEILNCSNCRIETIDEHAFHNLSSLTLLDLSNNFLRNLPTNVFYGVNEETCIILL